MPKFMNLNSDIGSFVLFKFYFLGGGDTRDDRQNTNKCGGS